MEKLINDLVSVLKIDNVLARDIVVSSIEKGEKVYEVLECYCNEMNIKN
ncbi:MAG: hypothetical protein Q8J85_07250 [Sulfuricurvum sp.]|nr:hypothetical protein [Sulfuricurvum sp.]MDP3022977.1 hypothetical protein [Sulfuricurvum sp.]